MKNIVIALASIFFATSAIAGQEYECKKSFHGCYTTYGGAKTSADVIEYVKDSEGAVQEVTSTYKLEEVIYQPKEGILVIKTTKENWMPNFSEVKAMFRDRNLYLKTIVFTWPGSYDVRKVMNFDDNHKGRVRYLALKEIKAPSENILTKK